MCAHQAFPKLAVVGHREVQQFMDDDVIAEIARHVQQFVVETQGSGRARCPLVAHRADIQTMNPRRLCGELVDRRHDDAPIVLPRTERRKSVSVFTQTDSTPAHLKNRLSSRLPALVDEPTPVRQSYGPTQLDPRDDRHKNSAIQSSDL